MKFGPIGIAGDLDQPKPSRHDHIEALAKRHRWGVRPNVSFVGVFAGRVTLRFAVTIHIGVPTSCAIVLQLRCQWDEGLANLM